MWEACLTLLRENAARVPNPVQTVGVEYEGVGNVDDVVLLRGTPPSIYKQLKYTVDSSTPVNEEYLTKPSPAGGNSVLKKIALAWRQLTAEGDSADLVLATNRAPDPSDELVAVRDARTGLLMPKAATGRPGSKLGRARARWAQAAGLTESELGELLSTLRFDLAQDMVRYQEHLGLLMAVTGLRHGQRAVEAGANWVAKMVREGRRELTLEMVQAAVADLDLKAGPARAVLSIATLKPDPLAANADYALDWADRFDGETAFDKRHPLAPNTWEQLQTDIEAAPQHLPAGSTAISVTGDFRLAPAFLIGATFRMVTGTDLAIIQGSQLWSSADLYDTALVPDVMEHRLDQGDELAVAVAVATDPTDDVLDYLRDQNLPVSKLLVYAPPVGVANDKSVPDGSAANALAVGIRDHLRRQTRPVRRLHLFLATPRGLALLLGHRWNRLCQTVVYEDIKVGEGYQPAFTVQA
ncbi:SAVED domain-containing protein [Kitasatospora sp. NPDC054939]